MNKLLTVDGLCKEYPGFCLNQVSFFVEKGTIMGFIGRNGAGKTTTLKALLNLVHPTAGDIRFFGLSFDTPENEAEIKQRIGYAAGGVNYYQRKRLKDIAAVTKTFYSQWDDTVYHNYLERFSLDESKKPLELSEGMKVKFNLSVALSHHAELLILDEPTSGLDPVSRDDLLEIFLELVQKGVSILFSTHITSDLDKCADSITYIRKGQILASDKIETFKKQYCLVSLRERLSDAQHQALLGICHSKSGDTGLIHTEKKSLFPQTDISEPDLETIMVHLEKEDLS